MQKIFLQRHKLNRSPCYALRLAPGRKAFLLRAQWLNNLRTGASYPAKAIIKLYKLFISPVLPPACRYFPSCSEYANEAVCKHGLLKGGFLAVKRIFRCNPFGGYGIDPVQRKKKQIKDNMGDNKSLFIAIILSSIVLVGWQYFYEMPKQKEILKVRQQQQEIVEKKKIEEIKIKEELQKEILPREEALKSYERVKISTSSLHGSISLKGLRFDDLTLAGFKESLDHDSKEVALLSPSNTDNIYFSELGWLPADNKVQVPDSTTSWKSDKEIIKENSSASFSWTNEQNVNFVSEISVDEHYMFKVTQKVKNNSKESIEIAPYGLISRTHKFTSPFYILHEGALGALNGTLEEVTYETLKSEKSKEFKSTTGWFGITDKYWLTALIPQNGESFDAKFTYFEKNSKDRFQVDYLGQKITVEPGQEKVVTVHFFAGAKKVALLDQYGKSLGINLFDRAIDFGWFYFITKPMFYALKYFQSLSGNFGIAILMLTVCVKLLMFPLANKSYKAMSQMKLLTPEMTRLKEIYKNDKMRLNQEVMALYKKEKVNPMSGCFPLLIQIPVFFSLYKVLFVTIEMRQAPFYGWIKDLSAPDPTTAFNLFGLLNWQPPAFLMIGILPIIMGITMIIQQKLNPEPTDPGQKIMMKILPYFFTYLFASFPAGLIIYWICNNTLSIIQQFVITKILEERRKNKVKKI